MATVEGAIPEARGDAYCTTHGLHRWYTGVIFDPERCMYPDLSKPPWDTAKVGDTYITIDQRERAAGRRQ